MRWTDLPEFENCPTDWKIVPLSQIADFIAGQSPDSSLYNTQGEGLPFLQGNAEFGSVNPQPTVFCSAPTKVCQPGDTLISVRAPVGALNRADQAYGLGRGVGALHPKEIPSEYLYQAMTRWHLPLRRAAQGSTFDAVTARHFRQLRCCLPTDPIEQKAIAELLQLADNAIAAAEAKLTAARRLKTALMQQLFTRGIPGRHSRFKQTKIGEIPESWELSPLRQLFCNSTNGLYVPDAEYGSGTPIIRIDTFEDGDFYSRDFDRVRISDREVELFEVKDGDVLFNRVNSIPFVGKVVFVNGLAARTVFESNMMRLRFDDASLAKYVALALCEPSTKRRIWSMARPAIGQLSINQRELGQFFIPLPQEDEQKEIVALIQAVNETIVTCETETQASEKLKRSLLQNLLTGRVRVRMEAQAAAD